MIQDYGEYKCANYSKLPLKNTLGGSDDSKLNDNQVLIYSQSDLKFKNKVQFVRIHFDTSTFERTTKESFISAMCYFYW